MCEKSRISKLVSLMYHVPLLVMTNQTASQFRFRGLSQSAGKALKVIALHITPDAGIPVSQSVSGKNIERS